MKLFVRLVCIWLLGSTLAHAQAPAAVGDDPAHPLPLPAPANPSPPPAHEPRPAPVAPTEPVIIDDGTLTPTRADHATCLLLDTTPGALLEPSAAASGLATPIPWSEFEVDGAFIHGDTRVLLHAIFEPTFTEHRTNFTAATWGEIAALSAKFGYQLVGHLISDQPGGARLTVHLAPLPLVRRVWTDVDNQSHVFGLFDKLLDDEVGRRLRVHPGAYLPWEPIRRQCALADERERVETYLHDEGYADATAEIRTAIDDDFSVQIKVKVNLGQKYIVGSVTTVHATSSERFAISDAEISATFHHQDNCLAKLCFSDARFTRTRLQEDLQNLRDQFHIKGYPTVRITSSFDPQISFDRRTHTVSFSVTVDPRRPLDVRFEGRPDEVSDEDLKKELTFDAASSSDDVEATASERALVAYLQNRGHFDARVTYERARKAFADIVTFHIDPGPTREVAQVAFVGASVMPLSTLSATIETKESGVRGSVLGTNTSATAARLHEDEDRITELYRRAGYRETRVVATASPTRDGVASAALTAAVVLAERGSDLFVRFAIDEGQATLLSRVAVEIKADAGAPDLCQLVLAELANELGERQFAKRDTSTGEACVATAANFAFREDAVATTRERLRDSMYRTGRPRAVVDYEAKPIGPHRVAAVYKLRSLEQLRIGKVVIRGNFKTRPSVINHELRLREGALLTSEALAEGGRRLRNTGLFDAVNIELPDLCGPTSKAGTCASAASVVNAVVRVEERFDQAATVDVLTGFSSYNGAFAGGGFAMRNIAGFGLVWTVNATRGTRITDLESTFQIPRWLVPDWSPIEFRTELTGLYRQQDTPRFGLLTTVGASIALTQQWARPRTATRPARVLTWGLARYDFRLRTREVDALRPIGTNQDSSQVAVGTRTGSVGMTFEWEQRVDRNGSLFPQAPEAGFRMEGSVAYASPYLLGQDTFVKLSGTGSKFARVGDNLILRGDLRVDWGIPLGGSVLLPEVERFFAGGDSTVRGYGDDKMATELLQVGVPPLGSNISQIRTLAAGGNIRVLASLDAQLRIFRLFGSYLAGALFTDAGGITNQWNQLTPADIRPSVGTGARYLTPVGILAIEWAVPLRPQIGDDVRGRLHFYFAARAQF